MPSVRNLLPTNITLSDTGVQPFHDQIGIRKCPLLSDMVTDPSKE